MNHTDYINKLSSHNVANQLQFIFMEGGSKLMVSSRATGKSISLHFIDTIPSEDLLKHLKDHAGIIVRFEDLEYHSQMYHQLLLMLVTPKTELTQDPVWANDVEVIKAFLDEHYPHYIKPPFDDGQVIYAGMDPIAVVLINHEHLSARKECCRPQSVINHMEIFSIVASEQLNEHITDMLDSLGNQLSKNLSINPSVMLVFDIVENRANFMNDFLKQLSKPEPLAKEYLTTMWGDDSRKHINKFDLSHHDDPNIRLDLATMHVPINSPLPAIWLNKIYSPDYGKIKA